MALAPAVCSRRLHDIALSSANATAVGERFAQVEIMAVIARIFKYYNVELDTAPFEDGRGSAQAKKLARENAAYELTAGVSMNLSLRMKRGVPLRFVPRSMGA